MAWASLIPQSAIPPESLIQPRLGIPCDSTAAKPALIPPPRQHEHTLLGQEVGEAAAGVEGEGAAVAVQGQAALDRGAELVAQRDKVADRAEMDVGRVVPGMVEQLGHRHPAAPQ